LGDIDLTDSATGSATDAEILKTPLHALHLELGGRMVPFAGYDMPVQYPLGIMKEHLHTRIGAGLFDVSHMGQVILRPKSGDVADAALALERLVPVNILGLAEGRQRYALFTSEQGGILDDLMVTNRGDHLFLVVNAACKDADEAHMRAHLSDACEIERLDDRALMALQGPQAGAVLAAMDPASADMRFMDVRNLTLAGADCIVSRSGYSGEDGFEISVPNADAETLARTMIAHDAVEPIGLGARDSLRLEAGLCLYGSDLDTTTSPVEASLIWAMQKVRRTGGDRAGGFPGAERILGELLNGASRKRVGLLPEGRAPVRGGAPLFAAEGDAEPVGTVTSGAFGPSLGGPMAMGYVPAALAAIGTRLFAEVRGKKLPVTVATMPFVTPNYKRG
jgi:aminomethyltransferase